MIRDTMAPAGEPPLADHRSHRIAVGPGPVPGPENDRSPSLGILEPDFIGPRQTHLGRIHDMENENLVAPMPEKAKIHLHRVRNPPITAILSGCAGR